MGKKTAVMALATVFLLQTQVWAAIENESEILGKNSKKSIPTNQNGKKVDSNNVSWGDRDPEVVSESDRQKEILSGKAKRSVSMEMEKNKENKPAKNQRIINGVIIEDKKDVEAEKVKLEEKQKNKEKRAKVLEESQVMSEADWQREILAGNSQRSTGAKRKSNDKIERQSDKDSSKIIRNGVIIEPKTSPELAVANQNSNSGQNANAGVGWQRDFLAVNSRTTNPANQGAPATNGNKENNANQVIRNGVIIDDSAADTAVKKAPRKNVLPLQYVKPAPIQEQAVENNGKTKTIERNGVTFVVKEEAPVEAKEVKAEATAEKKQVAKDEKPKA